MHLRTRKRINSMLALVITSLLFYLAAMILLPSMAKLLSEKFFPMLPELTLGMSVIPLALIATKHWFTYADVRHGRLVVRSLWRSRRVDLRRLRAVEVHAKQLEVSQRKQLDVGLILTDASGRQIYLVLNQWQNEDLLMARVLRATVDNRVRIEGDPLVVKRFTKLLDRYKSWDRQLAAAA